MKDSEKKENRLYREYSMSKKLSTEEKYKIVRRCISGELSQRHAAELYDVHFSSIQEWIRRYETEDSG